MAGNIWSTRARDFIRSSSDTNLRIYLLYNLSEILRLALPLLFMSGSHRGACSLDDVDVET